MNNADHTTDTSNTDGIAYAQYCATTVAEHPTIVHNQSRICRTLLKYMLEWPGWSAIRNRHVI